LPEAAWSKKSQGRAVDPGRPTMRTQTGRPTFEGRPAVSAESEATPLDELRNWMASDECRELAAAI